MKAAKQVNVHHAKTHLSMILADVEKGQEIILARDGKPIAKIIPFSERRNRISNIFGDLKGKIWIADDFDDPLPDELMKEWGLL